MGFTFRTNIPENMKKVLNKLHPDEALKAGALELGSLISDSAEKGQGLKGGFKDYTSYYKKKHGKVDLDDTGELMRNVIQPVLSYKKNKSGYTITMTLNQRIHVDSDLTLEELGKHLHKTRPFWGLTKKYDKIVTKVVIKELEKNYGKLNLN